MKNRFATPYRKVVVLVGVILLFVAGIGAYGRVDIELGKFFAAEPPQVFNIKDFYPFDTTKIFIWQSQLDKKVFEAEYTSYWPGDSTHFTIHRSYFNQGDTPKWCPTINDVYEWQKDGTLVYTQTIDDYRKTDTRLGGPGQIWGTAAMVAGEVQNNFLTAEAYTFDRDSGCGRSNFKALFGQSTYRSWRAIRTGFSEWSEFTGGKNKKVAAVRLDETTFFHENPDDTFAEQWFFTKDPILGWIAIRTLGFRKQGAGAATKKIWDFRLVEVRDR